MTDVLPLPKPAGAPAPFPTFYVPPPPAASRGGLGTAAWVCGLLFFVAIVVAGFAHPAIPAALLVLFLALPLAGMVLGAAARPRARGAIKLGGIELCLVLGTGLLLPSLCRSRESANLIKCASNLSQIGLAMTVYLDRHDGRFPPGLDVLIADPESELTADVLICPSTQDVHARVDNPAAAAREIRDEPGHLSYVYVAAGLTRAEAGSDRVIAYDKPHNHDAGIEVLYGDGHVNFLPKKEAGRVVVELGAGHNPTRPAAIGP